MNIWWRRAVAYILRIILPASLLSQLVGSVFCGRSSPGGAIGFWIDCSSAVVVRVISSWSTRNGQSWAHRLLRIQVLDQDSNLSISCHLSSESFGLYGTTGDGPLQIRSLGLS